MVVEVLENGRGVCIKNKLFTSEFLDTYNNGFEEMYAQLEIFLVKVMRLLLLRFLQPSIAVTRGKPLWEDST